jgi:2,4-diaminopentanoate dehydrogenase
MEPVQMLRIAHVGLGSLGLRIQRDLLDRKRMVVAAAVDPAHAGRRLDELVPGAPRIGVRPTLEGLEACDAAIVSTSSDLRECAAVFEELLDRGLAVVSTCEELVYPWLRHPELARRLDGRAKARGGRLLGAGVNPGFVMDALPAFATGACHRVRAVRVERIQDASIRRLPFQRKIGAGLTAAGFENGVREGWLRHVGLAESLHFVASALGREIERWDERIEPVLADRRLQSALGPIEPGNVAGVRQVATARASGGVELVHDFQAAIGQVDPRDRVLLDADPPIDLVIRGGVHGDTATSALAINALVALCDARPGLHTMATVPLVSSRDRPR